MFEGLPKGHTTNGPSPIDSGSDAPAGRPARQFWRNSKWAAFLAAGLITLATVTAFSSSFNGVFVLDDQFAILDNFTLRQLWPLNIPLTPPNDGSPVTVRPLLNLSLAVNYAISQDDIWSYHAANLTIHLTGALLLFGILLRIFDLPSMRDHWGPNRVPLASSIALLWAIHPLQTESVTYVSQRAESLVGLFYFLTLYCFVRGESSTRAGCWYGGTVLACLLGMASKEVMASAPLIVLLFDRTFCAGSFREAWRRHYALYLSLAATWVLLGWLVVSGGGRAGTVGFGMGISTWSYLQTQFWAIVHYLKLCLWPHPLLLDYGTGTITRLRAIVPSAVVVMLLGTATVLALRRCPKIGFLGAWFFMILAPSSSLIPVATQPIAEHRMYLPLAAVLAAVVTAASVAGRWLVERGTISRAISRGALPVVGGCLVIGVSLGFGILTFRRNQDYQSEILIWQDTVAKALGNGRAHNYLGLALTKHQRFDDAIAEWQKAVELDSEDVYAHSNLGLALAKRERFDEAIAHCQKAVELSPDFAEAHNAYGLVLAEHNRFAEAIAEYRRALEIRTHFPEARSNLGNALANCGRIDEAVNHFHQALGIRPGSAELHSNLGGVLVDSGRIDEGLNHLRKALEIQPDSAEARNNLGNALAKQERLGPAIAEFLKALEIQPGFALAHNNLGLALVKAGRIDEAANHFQKAVELRPRYAQAHYNLGSALKASGRLNEAAARYRQAVAISPENADFRCNFAIVLTQQGLLDEAIVQYLKALKIRPDHAQSQNNLGYAYVRQGRLDEAIPCYRKALQIQPRDARAHNNLGAALGQQGRFDEAIVHFQASLEIQPDYTGARNNLASALRRVNSANEQ